MELDEKPLTIIEMSDSVVAKKEGSNEKVQKQPKLPTMVSAKQTQESNVQTTDNLQAKEAIDRKTKENADAAKVAAKLAANTKTKEAAEAAEAKAAANLKAKEAMSMKTKENADAAKAAAIAKAKAEMEAEAAKAAKAKAEYEAKAVANLQAKAVANVTVNSSRVRVPENVTVNSSRVRVPEDVTVNSSRVRVPPPVSPKKMGVAGLGVVTGENMPAPEEKQEPEEISSFKRTIKTKPPVRTPRALAVKTSGVSPAKLEAIKNAIKGVKEIFSLAQGKVNQLEKAYEAASLPTTTTVGGGRMTRKHKKSKQTSRKQKRSSK